jgi:hypothetical protein
VTLQPILGRRLKRCGKVEVKRIEKASFVSKGFHFLENRTVSTEMSLLQWWTHLLGGVQMVLDMVQEQYNHTFVWEWVS